MGFKSPMKVSGVGASLVTGKGLAKILAKVSRFSSFPQAKVGAHQSPYAQRGVLGVSSCNGEFWVWTKVKRLSELTGKSGIATLKLLGRSLSSEVHINFSTAVR